MILLIEHDPGTDGWDARNEIVAVFDSEELAIEVMRQAGYIYHQDGSFYNNNPSRWGDVSYRLKSIPFHNEYTFPHR